MPELPPGPFDLVLCRNLVLTYFSADLAGRVLARILARLQPGGALVIGRHERLPRGISGLADWSPSLGIYRRSEDVMLIQHENGPKKAVD